MFTRRPFFSISVFHVCTFTSSSSMDSALIIRSSAYSSSHGQPVRNSLDRASNTMMKSRGLRTEPWWTPTPTPNSSLYPSPTLTLLLTSLYMDWTRRTNHSSIPSLRIAHQMTSRGTRSNAFSRSTKAHNPFTQKGHLITREKIHIGDKPYSCLICGKTFADKRNLSNSPYWSEILTVVISEGTYLLGSTICTDIHWYILNSRKSLAQTCFIKSLHTVHLT